MSVRFFGRIVLLFIFILGIADTEAGSHRSGRRFGLIFSGYGNLFPADTGLSLAIPLGDWARIHAGWGLVFTTPIVSAVGGGLDLVIPGLSLSPVIGAKVTQTLGDSGPNVLIEPPFGDPFTYPVGAMVMSGSIGLEYTFSVGFYLASGYSMMFSPASGGQLYFAAGKFF